MEGLKTNLLNKNRKLNWNLLRGREGRLYYILFVHVGGGGEAGLWEFFRGGSNQKPFWGGKGVIDIFWNNKIYF